MAESKVKVTYMPLSKLQAWERNPKQHDINVIKASIQRWGYVTPILINEKDQVMVAGHGRATALQELKDSGEPLPDRIVEKDGEWYVPVLRGVSFANKQEAEAYGLADNRATELGGWDEETLSAILQDGFEYDKEMILALGWDEASLERMLANTNIDNALSKDDLGDPGIQGDDDRNGRFVVVYLSETERKEIIRRLGLPEDWDSVTITMKDMQPDDQYI